MVNSVALEDQSNRRWMKVLDQVEQAHQMKDQLQEIIEWLDGRADQNVLIHCASGISRSATLVIALMISRKRISVIEAYQKVVDKRPMITPNNGFFRVLQEHQDQVLGLSYDEARRESETFQYNVFQLVSQLDFAGVTAEKAKVFLIKYGDISKAANYLLEDSGLY